MTDYPWAEDSAEAVIAAVVDSQECRCEFVDIEVGWQKVSEDPTCPRCTKVGFVLEVADALRKAGHLISPGAVGVSEGVS